MIRHARRPIGLVVIALGLLGLEGCGMSSAKPKAEAAIGVFHQQLDAIWTSADEALRNSTSRDSFDKFMAAVHRKLGRVVKTENTTWSIGNYNLRTQVTLVQNTQFERGSGVETFLYFVRGEKVVLAGYNINSTELVTL